MNITIEPLQLLKVQKSMGARSKEIKGSLQTILTKAVFIVEGYAKRESPVDTGRMRASIGGGSFKGGSFASGTGITIEKSLAVIAPTVDYAKYVNAKNPFMNRAAKKSLPDIRKIVAAEIHNAVK